MSETPAAPVDRPSPRVDLIRTLAVLAEPPQPGTARLAQALGLPGVPTASDYADVFLFHLYPYASVYLGPEGMIGGEARDRIAGFWRALGITPPAEPDHLAALLGLYASLAERESGAHDRAERLLLARARETLLLEHLEPWVFAWLERVAELAPAAYGAWAALVGDALRAELASADETGVPAYLRAMPGLPDPRTDGGPAFLGGLLAPVRAGAILTRADLARIAGEAEIGLRAGERRYVLEHLLAQDAPGVMARVSAELRRQAARHEERASRGTESAGVYPTAGWFALRANEAADLVEELAAAGAEAG